MKQAIKNIRSFAEHDRGGVAILFALSAVPLLLGVGIAVDYGLVVRTRANLQVALDAALLATTEAAVAQVSAGQNPNSRDIKAKFAQEINARDSGFRPATISASSVNYSHSQNTISISGTLNASVPAYFGNILGYHSYDMSIDAAVSQGSVVYSSISMALDVSPSMAIAATAPDIAKLKALTKAQTGTACAFACHDVDGGSVSNYTIARNGGVTLRIDEVKNAALVLVNAISTASVQPNQFLMGLYTMGSTLTTVVAPTPSASSIKTAVASVDFDRMSILVPTLTGSAPANIASGDSAPHYGDTDFATTLTALEKIVPANGTGTNPSSRQQYVFLVTDGLSDTGTLYNSGVNSTYAWPAVPNFANGNDAGKYTRPLDPNLCTSFKARGVRVAVVYVTYVADPADYWYQKLVQSNAPPEALVASLTACASPGLFYQASDSASISTGLTTLFQTILNRSVRLTE